ncbi:MAG: LPS assembly lipoprotein LptE [Vicinamibacterales bacterium]
MKRVTSMMLIALMSSGCGYALAGRGTSLPDYIRVIGVPLFKNSTPVFDVDRVITERVRTELIGRGKYEVKPEGVGVDAVVEATITSLSLTPATFDANRQASRYYITITASVSFKDLKSGKEIWANPSLSFRDEYQINNAASGTDVTAFFGQETNAVARLAADFARTVVSAMLEAF